MLFDLLKGVYAEKNLWLGRWPASDAEYERSKMLQERNNYFHLIVVFGLKTFL